MFYDIRFSHVSRFEFLKAHPRVHCDLRYARVSIVEKIDFAEQNKGITAYTRKSVRMGYDVRGTEGEGKTKGEKLRRTKRKEQRRTQKRAPELVPFAFIRSLRGHSALYILFGRLPFVYFFSFSRVSIFLASFSSVFHSRLRHRSLHRAPHVRADYALSSRNYFAYMPLPFSLSFPPLSVIPPTITYYPSPLAALSRGLL